MSGMKPGEDYPAFRDYMPWALEKGEQAYQDFVVAHNDTVKAIMGDHYDADIAVHPDSPSARYKLAVMERVLAAWKSTLAERNIPLLFLIIPSPIDVCAKYDFSVDSVQYPMYDRRRITREVEGMAQRQGLRSVSLWDSYLATGGCGMYFKNGNNHWNVAGQALAAKITADSLFALGIPK